MAEAYEDARELAADETKLGLSAFPEKCPYVIAQVLEKDWLPAQD